MGDTLAGGRGGGVSGICGRNKVSQTFESIFKKSVKQSEFEHWSFVVRCRCSTHRAITTMATNELLQKAKKSKSDEFYTQLPDIESELQNLDMDTLQFVLSFILLKCMN